MELYKEASLNAQYETLKQMGCRSRRVRLVALLLGKNANVSKMVTDLFIERNKEFSLLKWSPQSPDLGAHWRCDRTGESRDLDFQPTNL